MRHLPLILFATALAWPAVASGQMVSGPDLAGMFCKARVSGDMSAVEAHLSASLTEQIEEALARNDELQKQAPDDKPPLGDGIPWQSFPDTPSECRVAMVVPSSAPVDVPVTYSFTDAPDAGWTDTLVLRQQDGGWVIDDIRYSTGSSLHEVLESVFAD